MDKKRILIVRTGSLLMDGVERLLRSHSKLEMDIVSTAVRDHDLLVGEIGRWSPEVVLMEDVPPFVAPVRLLSVLPSSTNLRVISLNSQTNRVDIYTRSAAQLYNRYELVASNPEHLIAALASE